MFFSFDLRKCAKILLLFAGVLILAGCILSFTGGSVTTFMMRGDKLPFLKAEGDEKRRELISSLGWEVKEVYSHQKVIVPKEFDETYFKYNELQKKQGLNLRFHKGKMADKYTYIIENYPGDVQNVRLTLLLRKGKVIAGDVCSLGREGFMHTLFYPEDGGSLEKDELIS